VPQKLNVMATATLLALGVFCPALAAPPAYSGTYVIVDPYDFVDETPPPAEPLIMNKLPDYDMHFLYCATEVNQDIGCYPVSASNDDFLNPFTGVQWTSTGVFASTPAANGILLRIPWCAFQTNAVSGAGEPAPTLGECHYQVQGITSDNPVTSPGYIYAGAYTDTSSSSYTQVHQLYSPTADPQSGIDPQIGNLSACTTPYDTCSSSVLDTALNYIATIAAETGSPLKLSVSLMAGQYTPTSVMSSSGVLTLDFPQGEGGNTSCTRQPLAWHTIGVNPYVATRYELDYTAAVLALGAEIRRVMILRHAAVQINIIKESGITSNSIEFDVAARNSLAKLYTYTDPSSPPPQNDAAIQCPDHYPVSETMSTALVNAFALTNSTYVMSNAYEYTFGYIMGFEDGLASQPGPATGAMLSVPTKGQQAFAQVDCGQLPNQTTCIVDPSPVADQYNWEDYYFFQFLRDFSRLYSRANEAAAAGYSAACGANCAAFPGTIGTSQMSVVNTGLDVSKGDLDGTYNPSNPSKPNPAYATEPQCWINVSAMGATYTLDLYNSNNSTDFTQATLTGTGVVLGWQTQIQSGKYCYTKNYQYSLDTNGGGNGGQYYEIETDAAAETTCEPDLSRALSNILSGDGNPQTTCATSP
jgi:hypothetical protein